MAESEEQTSEAASQDAIPLKEKLAYGVGVVGDHYSVQKGIWMLWLPFFNDMLKVSAVALGSIMALVRIWDAINDPLIGWLSDRSKSRFGRRRPFIFVGAIAMGLTFPLLWFVPESWSDDAKVIHIGITVLMLYTAYSVWSVPYESLGAELTSNYEERTNLFVVRTYLLYILTLGIDWMLLLALTIGAFAIVGGEVNGVRVVGVLVGVLVIATGIMPALFTKERFQKIAVKQEKISLGKAITTLITNRPLFICIGSMAFLLLAVISSASFAYYVNTYLLFGGDKELGVRLTAIDGTLRLPFALLGAFVLKRLSNRIDKHQLLKISLVMLMIAYTSFIFTHKADNPYLSLSTKPLLAFGESWFWILVISMRADACDWDELRCGQRREGIIAAATNWCNKFAIAISGILGGFALEVFAGFDSKRPETAEDPAVLQELLYWYAGIPAVGMAIVFGLVLMYPLTREKMTQVQQELETRRGAVA